MRAINDPPVAQKKWSSHSRILLLIITGLLVIITLNAPISTRSGIIPRNIGDVASQDIQSPVAISYESQVLTNQAIASARAAVDGVYLPADPAIKRLQMEKLRVNLRYITLVKQDPYSSRDQKLDDLSAMQDLQLSGDMPGRIIDLSQNRWQSITGEAEKVLDVVFRSTIRTANMSQVNNEVPSLVDTSFTQSSSQLIVDLVSPFIIPNSLYSEELTEAARAEVEKNVTPVIRKYEIGQIIIQHGQVMKAEDLEALERIGLGSNAISAKDVLGTGALVIAVMVFLAFYGVRRRNSMPMADGKSLALIAATFLFFLVLGRFIIPYRTVVPFLFPAAAFGLTLATAFTLEIGLVFSLVLCFLLPYGLPGSLEITTYYLMGSLIGILVLGRGRNLASVFKTSLGISAANILVVLAYNLADPVTDWLGIATLVSAAVVNGVASATFTLLFQYVFSQALGLTTALQLLDLSRPDHPLLQMMLRNAPGSYQHSLQVANLAEQAAEAINADTLLVRVGAQYHDIGKALNPQFFIENQVKGNPNPHEDLDPAASAVIIIRHVEDGVSLAKKYRLPPKISDFIREHHGSLLAKYQYNRALSLANNDESLVDRELFRYPGPAPRSRETALLMLADGCEARARAELPKDEAGMLQVVRSVIDKCIQEGQLETTTLTLLDLNKVTAAFTNALMGVYHQRIIYPEVKPKTSGTRSKTTPKNRETKENGNPA